MNGQRWRVPVSIVVCVALLVGCAQSGAAPADPRSGPALEYGLAPHADDGTEFRDDVVLVEGGATSVRSVTADGLTWTLAPEARGLADLAPGRVMFLTERAVGRVVAIATTDAGVEVTMGPVDVTEVIEEGSFESDGEIALTEPIAISQDGAFWADPELQQQAGVPEGSGADVPVAPAALVRIPAALPRPVAPAAVVAETVKGSTGAFNLTGSCCANGPGADFSYNRNGLAMTGRIGMNMDRPRANFRLRIAGASIQEAGLTVRGAAGITTTLQASAAPGPATSGFSPPLGTDFTFSVPVGVFFGVPLSMVVTQRFTLSINIPGSATLDAVGKVKLGSTIGFAYGNGTFQNTTTAELDSSASLTATNALAVGISYATFDYSVRFTVGFGLAGFVAGAYLALAAHVMSAVGAPIGINVLPDAEDPIEHCKSVQADLWVDYGVGYTIPSVVAEVINFFLTAFKSTPIPKQGGLSHGWSPVLSKYEVHPQSGFCVNR